MSDKNPKVQADIVIKNAAQLVTCAENAKDLVGIIENGWIAMKDEKIVALGKRKEVLASVDCSQALELDASNKVVVPGFIDSHTHLVFGGSRVKEYAARLTENDVNKIHEMGIETGIMASVKMTRQADEKSLINASAQRLKGMLCAGTTTVESKSGYGLSTMDEIKILKINQVLNQEFPVDIVSTFLGAHGWPNDIPKHLYIKKLVEEMIPHVGELGLAQFCDVWCDAGHFTAEESRTILEAGRAFGLEAKIHTDAYSYIGGSDLAAEMHMVSADHLNYTPRTAMKKLAKEGVVGVLLPAIDFAVKHPQPFDVRPMLEEGMTLALATNLCPGCWTLSLQFVMQLACRNYGMSPAEAVRSATLGGAKALGLADDRGSLEKGKLADIQIWDVPTYEDVVYRLAGNVVEKVIKRGKMVVDKNIPCLHLGETPTKEERNNA